jgi:hypothetical protein
MDYDNTFAAKHTITRKQMMWGAGAVGLILLYMNPWVIQLLTSPFRPHPAVKPSPIHQTVLAPPPPIPQAPPEPPALSINPVGKWFGRNLVRDRGTCQLGLEISPKPGLVNQYLTYSSLTCVNYLATGGKMGLTSLSKIMEQKLSPSSTVLSGDVVDATIVYHVDKAIDSIDDKCVLSSMTVTPFGSGVVKAVWKDSCGVGEIGLARVR